MRLPFVDADTEIETAASMTITEIFERFGEPHFRDGERRVIARLMDGKPKVVATGGGAFLNEQTRRLILEHAIAVWLDAEPAVLADRVRRRDTRPLLRNRDPEEVLRELAAVRNPFYALAPIRVQSVAAPHDATVDAILKAIRS
jgi:shikimate kinase